MPTDSPASSPQDQPAPANPFGARKLTSVLLEVGEVEWAQWQHSPITAAFLAFLDDNIQLWRENAADVLENGGFHLRDAHEDRNPDVVRGKILAFRGLRRLTLSEIQEFYRQAARE